MSSFVLSRGKSQECYIFIRFRKPSQKIDKLINTRITINRKVWKELNNPNSIINFRFTPKGEELFNKLNKIKEVLRLLWEKNMFTNEYIREAITTISSSEALKIVKDLKGDIFLQHSINPQQNINYKNGPEIMEYYEEYVRKIKEGKKRNGSDLYSINTIKSIHGSLTSFRDFYNSHPIGWNDLSEEVISDYVLFMEKSNCMTGSINLRLRHLKMIVNYALNEEVHNNSGCLKYFVKKKELEENGKKKIYLTTEELDALYAIELPYLEDRVRDLFLLGCYTCLRMSDFLSLKKGNFTVSSRGVRIINVTQKKTHGKVSIPILNDRVLAIAEKYDYNFPKITDASFRSGLKSIMRKLSLVQPSLLKEELTPISKSEKLDETRGIRKYNHEGEDTIYKPRYKLVSSHTARRSGITNLYLSGKLDITSMMAISGHKTEETFRSYIKLSSEEFAEQINDKFRK